MAKSIWLSSLVRAEEEIKKLITQMKTYGIEVNGHFWEDNLANMAWMSPREELIKPEVALWLILADEQSLTTPTIRYGLSLLAITVQANRGLSFPIIVLLTEGTPPAAADLPTSLKSVEFLSLADTALPAKLVAKVHAPSPPISSEYRLDVYGNAQIGQWFEIGPTQATWSGAMFGISVGEITFHAVGQKGFLPERAVLNYPLKGIKLNLGEKEFVAWAVQNEINSQSSYFVKVKGFPDAILFGPYAQGEETEVYVVRIK